MEKEIDLRRLVIKAFHITEVEEGGENKVTASGKMTIEKKILDEILPKYPQLSKLDVQIIRPGEHDCYTNTMMDIIPISTKVLGKIGDGITHTLTGVYVILTGVDENGKQAHEFGSSEGNLKEKLYLNRAGTPGDDDYIVSFDVVLKPGMGQEREGVLAAHHACDEFIQIFREQMKKFRGDLCTERHEYHDVVRPGKKRVLIVKQVAGQGAMYDTSLFAKEPSGTEDGRSIIDMGNMPVIVTPNEYRDGIIRSMQVGGAIMGIGPSTKETSLHHFRDPLLDVVSSDEDLDLMGIIIVGTPDDNTDKLLVGTRAAVWAEAMRADGVILSSDGWGNSDVDFANTAEQMEIRGIPVTGLKFSGTVGQFVVENDHLGEILDINKSEEGIETDVLGENNVTELDAKKVTAMLKLKMRKNEKR